MRYRKKSPTTGDYQFGHGQVDFYRDEPAAVGQACETRLTLWLGESFIDIEEGTPYIQGVLGKQSLAVANGTIQMRVLGTQGLTDLTNFQSVVNPDTRGMTVAFDIDTLYGPTAGEIKNYGTY